MYIYRIHRRYGNIPNLKKIKNDFFLFFILFCTCLLFVEYWKDTNLKILTCKIDMNLRRPTITSRPFKTKRSTGSTETQKASEKHQRRILHPIEKEGVLVLPTEMSVNFPFPNPLTTQEQHEWIHEMTNQIEQYILQDQENQKDREGSKNNRRRHLCLQPNQEIKNHRIMTFISFLVERNITPYLLEIIETFPATNKKFTVEHELSLLHIYHPFSLPKNNTECWKRSSDDNNDMKDDDTSSGKIYQSYDVWMNLTTVPLPFVFVQGSHLWPLHQKVIPSLQTLLLTNYTDCNTHPNHFPVPGETRIEVLPGDLLLTHSRLYRKDSDWDISSFSSRGMKPCFRFYIRSSSST